MNNNEINEFVGKHYGRWRIDSLAYIDKKSRVYFNCTCECGAKRTVQSSRLKLGKSLSCGCYMRYKNSINKKHGKWGDALYSTYSHIKSRCYNQNDKNYKNYGGRGIKVCDEWLGENGFMNFYNWAIENGYDKSTYGNKSKSINSLDRINNEGDYSPTNCRFVDSFVQNNNKRNNIKYNYNGNLYSIKELAKIFGIKETTLYYRLKNWEIENALNKKVQDKKRRNI